MVCLQSTSILGLVCHSTFKPSTSTSTWIFCLSRQHRHSSIININSRAPTFNLNINKWFSWSCRALHLFDTSDKMSGNSGDRVSLWTLKWSEREIGFHQGKVNSMLEKHVDQLKTDGLIKKILVPLCGKAVDIKWLSDQGTTVVGIDAVPTALEEFFADNNLEYDKIEAPAMGPDCSLFQSKDKLVQLFCGDIFKYNESVAGTFDAIWDRGSLVALNRPDVKSYVQLIKSLLNPGGKILLEVLEYDVASVNNPKYPPPHPMYEDELKNLYEPECVVEKIDWHDRTLGDKTAKVILYLVTKK